MKKIGMILALLLTFVACSGKQDSTKQGSGEKKVYKIGTDVIFAPFEFEKDGKYVGIDIEILDAIAKVEGFEYTLHPMNFNGLIPAISSSQLDGAIAGMTITDERKQVLDFSEGYYESGISAVVSAKNDKIKSVEDFKGKTFAVKKGTTGSLYAEDHQKEFGSQIRYFDDSPSMFQEVANGNADITFEDYPVIAYKLSLEKEPTLKIVGDKLSTAHFGFAVKKGQNQELLQKFNSGLKKIKESGEYDKILNNYK